MFGCFSIKKDRLTTKEKHQVMLKKKILHNIKEKIKQYVI